MVIFQVRKIAESLATVETPAFDASWYRVLAEVNKFICMSNSVCSFHIMGNWNSLNFTRQWSTCYFIILSWHENFLYGYLKTELVLDYLSPHHCIIIVQWATCELCFQVIWVSPYSRDCDISISPPMCTTVQFLITPRG